MKSDKKKAQAKRPPVADKTKKKSAGTAPAKKKAPIGFTTPAPAPAVDPRQVDFTAVERVELLPVADVARDPGQPRKAFELEDIVSTLRADAAGYPVDGHPVNGIRVPIIVRPVEGEACPWMIIEGERRWRSAQQAGLRTIPAIVRAIPADRVLEEQIVAGTTTRSLRPLEVADGLVALRSGPRRLTAEDLALRTGLARPRVYKLLALATLGPEARAALESGELAESVALEVATVAPAEQGAAIKAVGALPVRYARDAIRSRFHRRLRLATFDPKDETLSGGACEKCPHNSTQQRSLLDEDEDAEARCLRKECFEAKAAETWQRKKEAAEASGVKVLEGKEAEKVAPFGWPTDDSGLVDLGAVCPHDEDDEDEQRKPRTWGEVLGASVKPSTIAKNNRGEELALITKEEAVAGLRAQGLEEAAQDEEKERRGDALSDERKRVRAADARGLARAITEADNAITGGRPLDGWRWLALFRLLDGGFWDEHILAELATHYGVEVGPEDADAEDCAALIALRAWLKTASPSAARGFVLRLELGSVGGYEQKEGLELLGVNLHALCNQERAADGLPLLPAPEPEPELDPVGTVAVAEGGTCVVCGCDDDHGCEGGCAWADEAGTICTPCAEMRDGVVDSLSSQDWSRDDMLDILGDMFGEEPWWRESTAKKLVDVLIAHGWVRESADVLTLGLVRKPEDELAAVQAPADAAASPAEAPPKKTKKAKKGGAR